MSSTTVSPSAATTSSNTAATPAAAPVTPERIMQFAWGYVPPLVLEAAIRHHVFDVLDAGAKTVEEVEGETGASPRGLTAIMNALVGMQLLTRDDAGKYALTAESSTFLVSTKPAFHGGMIQHTTSHLIPRWMQLGDIVASGRPAQAVNQEETGGQFFHNFVEALFPLSYPSAQALAAELALTSGARVLDLAAGSGVWSIALAQSGPGITVTVVDWPEVTPVTRKVATRFGLLDRYSFVEQDMAVADFGTGHTVATLGHILHSEGEARSRTLLKKTFDALAPGGTIAIAEFLVNADRRGPVPGLFFAVNMLVNTEQGDTYSFEEIGGWLEAAGFVNARLLQVPGPSPLILATKP